MERITFQIPTSTLTHGLRYCKFRIHVVDQNLIVEYLMDDLLLIIFWRDFMYYQFLIVSNLSWSSIKSFTVQENQELISESIELNTKSWSLYRSINPICVFFRRILVPGFLKLQTHDLIRKVEYNEKSSCWKYRIVGSISSFWSLRNYQLRWRVFRLIMHVFMAKLFLNIQ